MHGQKKRRKRSIDGSITVDGVSLYWRLLSEPQWTSEHGYKGLCISVRTEDRRHRELVLEYPFPKKCRPNGMPHFLNAPSFPRKQLRLASVKPWIQVGSQPLVERPLSFSCPEIQTETPPLTLFRCRRERRQARIGRFRRTDLVLTIRLSRIGKKKKPFYRVVVIERTRPRDGRVKEAVGTYDPLKKPAEIKLNADRIKYWMGLGAQPSDTVRSFLRQQKIA